MVDDKSICLEGVRQNSDGKESIYLCHGVYGACDGQHALVHAGNDLADASLDAGAVSKLSDILASASDDDACVFCADQGTEGEGPVLGWRGGAGGRRGGGGGGGVGGHGGERRDGGASKRAFKYSATAEVSLFSPKTRLFHARVERRNACSNIRRGPRCI